MLASPWMIHLPSYGQDLGVVTDDIPEDEAVQILMSNMVVLGLPSDIYIKHHAMYLEYDEEHEQAKWVAHVISPRVKRGKYYRSNDYRPDPDIVTGSSVEEDYFLKHEDENGKMIYDGFGFHRGHLAPAEDFNWTEKGMTESFYNSNFSPQREVLNGVKWKALEDAFRNYAIDQDVNLYVITCPILNDDLPKIERSVNHVSIPQEFVKIGLDIQNRRGIAVIMTNDGAPFNLVKDAISIDSIESKMGMNFFPNIDEAIESEAYGELWFGKKMEKMTAIDIKQLPKGYINTISASHNLKTERTVCGIVKDFKYSASGNLWLYLDNDKSSSVFAAYVKKENLSIFPPDMQINYMDKAKCFTGKIYKFDNNGYSQMRVESPDLIQDLVIRNSSGHF